MVGDAVISPCEKYRYKLTRKWADGLEVLFVMLNPSTADAFHADSDDRAHVFRTDCAQEEPLIVG